MPKLVEDFVHRIIVPPGARDAQVFDDDQPGFGIRKFAPSKGHPAGYAAYFVKYKIGKQQRRITLGTVVRGNLKSMRLAAAQILLKARTGTDTAVELQAIKSATVARGQTLGKLAKEYLDVRRGTWKPRYYLEVERHLTKDWKALADTPISSITRQNVVDVIDKIAAGQGKAAADHARIALSTLFVWAADKGCVEASPIINIKARWTQNSRTRALSPMELVDVWNAATVVGGDYERIVKLLILTGQRRTEIGNLAWCEVTEFDGSPRIDLPPPRTKNGLPHIVPLSKQALAQIPPRPDATDSAPRVKVFGRGRCTGYSGWSRSKSELGKAIAEAYAKRRVSEPMPAWVLHDLRRTFVTLMGELGIAQPHIIEATVNHVSGHKANVAGVYNRALYLDQRRRALAAWGDHVERLVSGPSQS